MIVQLDIPDEHKDKIIDEFCRYYDYDQNKEEIFENRAQFTKRMFIYTLKQLYMKSRGEYQNGFMHINLNEDRDEIDNIDIT